MPRTREEILLERRHSKVVSSSCVFSGLATEEIAEVLGVSASTVKRDWNVARAWLTRYMKKGTSGEGGSVEKN
jgi:DNA-directed RNA polymerase specialized sigma24 family protein